MSLRKKILALGLLSLVILVALIAIMFMTPIQGIGLVILLGLAAVFALLTWVTLLAAIRARPMDDISDNIFSEIFNLIF